MSDGGELDRERESRAARMADELISAMFGDVDVDQALGQVTDAPAVLGALVRRLAMLIGGERLRRFDLVADVEAVPDDDDAPAVPDDALPADPWATSGDAASNALEEASALFEGLAGQDDVAGLLRGLGTLSESEALAIVLEQALRKMAERQRPSKPAL